MNKLFSRRRVRISLVVAGVSIVMLALYHWLAEEKGLYHTLPAQIALVLDIKGMVKLKQLAGNTPDPAWKSVLQTSLFRTCIQDAGKVEQIFQHDTQMREALLTHRILAGLSLQDADSLHALFAIDVGYVPDINQLLRNAPGKIKFFPANFKTYTLYTIYTDKQERIVLAQTGNVLIFSRFSYLVEDALIQWNNSGAWWAHRKFEKNFEPAAWLHISLRPSVWSAQLTQKLLPAWRNLPLLIQENIEWLGLAWDGEHTIGLAETKGFAGGMNSWGAISRRNDIFNILPDHMALLGWSGFNNRSLFWGQLTDLQDSDFKRFILPWVGDEAAFVLTEPHSPGMMEDQFVVLGVQDSAKALDRLRAYGASRGALRTSEYQTFEIFNFLNQGILDPLVGDQEAFRNPVCAMLGSYVVFAGNRSALEIWIDKYIVNQTISNNTDFLQLKNQFAGQANGMVFLNTAYLSLLCSQLCGPEAAATHAGDLQLLGHTGMIGIECQSRAGNRLELSIRKQEQDKTVAETGILWKTQLGAEAASSPYLIPLSEGGDRILIQDGRHEICCLHTNGAVAWRRQLNGAILSDIKGIDFLGNKTTCYVFNTAEHIFVLDGKGQDMDGFPMPLQSKASNGMCVVDFDQNFKFNYFVACENNNIYGYDQFGRPLPGWNPQSGVGRVSHPLLHFQHDHKDFIVALNTAGSLFVFGQNGATRFQPRSFAGTFERGPQVDADSRSPHIVCVNTSGTFFVCNLDGNTYTLKPGSSAAKGVHGLFAPMGGDGGYEYTLLQGAQLSIGAYENGVFKTLITKQMASPQDALFEVPGQRMGTLNRARRQIFLVDGRGAVHPDFPLAGTTPFLVSTLFGKSGESVLIVGNGASVYAYKIK